MFNGNDDVKFADSMLSGGGPRGSGSPGRGGWPTIRYYNAETGVAGADYVKKTSAPMCEELGPKGQLLVDYVLEAGGTSLCSIQEPYTGCSEKEIKYIKKHAESPPEKIDAQIARLAGMMGNKMQSDLMQWIKQRSAILKAYKKASAAKSEL